MTIRAKESTDVTSTYFADNGAAGTSGDPKVGGKILYAKIEGTAGTAPAHFLRLVCNSDGELIVAVPDAVSITGTLSPSESFPVQPGDSADVEDMIHARVELAVSGTVIAATGGKRIRLTALAVTMSAAAYIEFQDTDDVDVHLPTFRSGTNAAPLSREWTGSVGKGLKAVITGAVTADIWVQYKLID